MIRTKNLSLRQILIASSIVQVFVAVGLTGYLSWQNGRKTIETLALRLSREVTSHTEKHVANFLNTPTTFLKLNRVLVSSQRLDLNNFQDLQANFWQQTQIDAEIDTLYFGNEEGNFIEIDRKTIPKMAIRDANTAPYWHMYRLDQQGQKLQFLSQKRYDPRQRPWYKAAKAQDDLVWSPIYLFADPPVLGITPAVPLRDVVTKKLNGVMAIDITLSQISEFLHSLKISDSGRAFIIEKSGQMVATSTNNSLITKGVQGNERLHFARSSDLLIKTTANYLATELNNFEDATTQQLIFEFKGNRHFVQVNNLNNYPGIDWLMVTVIPEADFLEHMRQNIYTTLALSALALVSAIFLGAIANQLIINSATHVSTIVKAIAQGQKIEIETQPQIREFASVTESIELMAQQLNTSTLDMRNLKAQYTQRFEEATSNLKQENQKLHHLANIDSLTQIYNRYYFDLSLKQLWHKANQEETTISLIMCDVDNFKLYNDTYGHLRGDQCLSKVAQAIRQAVERQQDIVARYGGEEIAIILPETDEIGAVIVTEKIIDSVSQLNLQHCTSMVSDRVTLSCGVASLTPDPQVSSLQLIQSADQALYQAKRQGKNRYVLNPRKMIE
ncbi:MAG: diguanylate cyclase [Cyanobacteria bacterium J06600_6]